ncbi:MAG: hypothetical protein ACN4GT_11610, partial [Gammaproteobacteria bacterium]
AQQVKRVQKLDNDSGAPFHNILVVSLFSDFGARRTLEKRIVSLLAERGTEAVASTSMMDTKTPLTKSTFIDMIDNIGADSLLVSQIIDAESDIAAKDASPETTVNVRPTYYFNVWDVQVTEYVEPQFVVMKAEVLIATQMLSVAKEDTVWGIEAKIKYKQEISEPRPYGAFDDAAESIVKHLARDKLIARK